MATKNYMINDKWLDINKKNIIELQSVDGVLDGIKVNGSETVTPSGKITITENGTDIDIAQYALADVNVEGGGGSSDLPQGVNLSYYHLIINCAPTEYDGNLTFASVGDPTSLYCPVENGQIMTELEISYSGGIQNKEIDILALTLSENAYSYLQYISIPDGFSVSATGGVTAGQDSDGWYLNITGSGTITIS